MLTEEDIRRGAGCPTCGRPFTVGEPYSTRLIGFVEDVPLAEVICRSCAMTEVENVGDEGDERPPHPSGV